jgi:UDP-N-acetylglucosamine enolpyruvyl transferase
LNLQQARVLTPGGCAQGDRVARILAAAIAAVQYFWRL